MKLMRFINVRHVLILFWLVVDERIQLQRRWTFQRWAATTEALQMFGRKILQMGSWEAPGKSGWQKSFSNRTWRNIRLSIYAAMYRERWEWAISRFDILNGRRGWIHLLGFNNLLHVNEICVRFNAQLHTSVTIFFSELPFHSCMISSISMMIKSRVKFSRNELYESFVIPTK